MARERVDVKQAAQILGISTDAVHKRAKRGTLLSDKDPDGRVFVYLDNNLDGSYTRPDNGYTYNGHGNHERTEHRDELLEELRDRVRALEEANRENRRIIAALTSRIPQLEAPRDEPGDPEAVAETSGSGDVPPAPETPSSHRSWWQRLFGG